VIEILNGNLRQSSILALFIAMAFLVTACREPSLPSTTEPAPQPTATPVATTPDLPLAEVPLSKELRFDRISTEQGLSGNEVWSIAQDKQGFMWFGTTNGLNRYDGYAFKVFKHDPDDPNSLSENLIRALYTDHTGTLWIGTWSGGLNRYVPESDQFIRYQHDPDDPHSLGSDSIRAIFEDQAGTMWLGTVGGGLNRFDRETEQFVRYLHDPDDPGSLSGNDIYSIYEDREGALWIATWAAGLNKFDRETEQFTRYLHDPADPSTLSNNNPYAIFEDQAGVLWVGTWDGGLNRFDRETEQFTRFLHDPDDPSSLSHDQAISIYEDQAGDLWIGTNGGGLNRFDRKSEQFVRYQHISTDPASLAQDNVVQIFEDEGGIVWIGTFGGGVSIYDRRKQHFAVFQHDPLDSSSLSSNDVWAIHEDPAGNLWVGTNGGGLNRFDRETRQFSHYLHDPDDPQSLSNNTVRAIYEDNAGQLWLGTSGGLNRYNPQTKQFKSYLHNPDDANSLSHNTVLRIIEDQTGLLWIATLGGLNSFNRETEQFTRFLHDPDDPNSLSHDVVWTIYEDRADDLWVGTESGGLNRFDRETKQFIRYRHDRNDHASLSSDGVKAIHEDQSGTLWIGTFGGGLNRFDRNTGGFTHYGEKEGLPGDTIETILEGEQGNLWLGTSSALSRFDPQGEVFRNYDKRDGLQTNEFNFNAAFRRSDGQMFFGGVNGLNAFYPADLQDNSHVPPIVITDFQLANESVPIGGDSVLLRAINETNDLVLSYQDRVISFEFTALDYAAPDKNRFRYKLEGFEDAWNEVDSDRRFATYTNLDPGDYVFRVIASNNDGVWNEEGASIKITITPPWWETTWFRIGLVLLVVGLLVGGFGWRVRSLQVRSRELEAQIQSLFDNSPVGIALSTYRGEILTFNKALLDMLRISEEELRREGAANFYANSADRAKLLAAVQKSGSVQEFGIPLVRKDGDLFFGSVNMSRLVLEGNEVLLVMAEDVTDEITAEQETAALEERERLAHELHDAVTQTLFSASVLAQSSPRMIEKNPALAKDNFERLARLINGALAEMRTLLLELRPNKLRESDLSELFELLAQSMRAQTRANISLSIEDSCSPPEDVAIAFYRIAQETLNNVTRHAMASEVIIELTGDEEAINLSIRDDGRGFDQRAIPAGHLGISIMEERAQKIGATIEIDSVIGGGTQVILRWPAVGKDNEHE